MISYEEARNWKPGNVFTDENGRLYMLVKMGYKKVQMICLYGESNVTLEPVGVEISYDITPGEVERISGNKKFTFYKESSAFYSEIFFLSKLLKESTSIKEEKIDTEIRKALNKFDASKEPLKERF